MFNFLFLFTPIKNALNGNFPLSSQVDIGGVFQNAILQYISPL